MHRAYDPARRVEQDVEEDNRQSDFLPDDPEQDEDVSYHHGREELQEVLDPQMNNPEAPEVGSREVGVGAGEQADRVEGGDGKGREEEEPGHVARVLPPETSAHHTKEHKDPEKEADREQCLPETPEVQVFPALVAEPRPEVAHKAVDPEKLPDQAPEDHDGQ